MQVIGASLLADYGKRNPDALPALKSLAALLRTTQWKSAVEFDDLFNASLRRRDGPDVVLGFEAFSFAVAMKINHEIGLVRITGVSDLKGKSA